MRRMALALVLTVAPITASAATWSTSPIDTQSGWTVSMLVDQAFHAHAAYWTPNAFKYAFYDGSVWQIDTIPMPLAAANASSRAATPAAAQLILVGRTSLALAGDSPWIAYLKVQNTTFESGPLRVSHKQDGAWVTEDIGEAILGVHLAARDDGTIYLAFMTSQGPKLGIRSGTWTIEPIGIDGVPLDLRLDRTGTPWVLYSNTGALRVARRDGAGAWTILTVDNPPSTIGSALQFDSQDRPCVAYGIQTPNTAIYRLNYARWTGTAWVTTWVDVAGDHVGFESLVLDGSDQPWIAYRDLSSDEVKVARQTNGAWGTDVVDTPAWNYAAITLDALGRHWMAYNAGINSLRLARTAQPTGVGDPSPAVHALRLEAATNPVRSGDATSLRLASPSAGSVTIETFDVSGRRLAAAQTRIVGAGITDLAWTAPATRGLCLVRATIGGRSVVARMVVTR